MPTKEDLTGQIFGRLTVIKYSPEQSKINKRRTYLCQCSCGNLKYVRGYCLKSGHTQSCGCLQKEKVGNIKKNKFNDLTNKKFHLLTAIKLDENNTREKKATYWFFKCDCGKIKSIRASNVIDGTVKSCGCVKNSYGEASIVKILSENNISYKKEYIFPDFKSEKGEYFRFDFAIFNKKNQLKYIIEFNGEQHYKPVPFFNQKISFENIQKYDKIKMDFCENKKIPLFIIRFDDEITKEKIIKEELLNE